MRTRRILIAIAVVPAALICWGLFIGPNRLEEKSQVVSLPNLPASWQGRKVAFISDLQTGMWWNNTGTIRTAIEQIVHTRPDVLLIGGDITENPGRYREQISNAAATLRPLGQHGIRTFAVLGNHDYSLVERGDEKQDGPAMALAAALQENGITVLKNEARAVTLGSEAEPVYIVGLGSHWAGNDDPVRALGQVPPNAPRIVFMHNPDSYAKLPASSAPLAICGHTHGGQIALPFTPQWSWLSFAVRGDAHAEGWQPDYGAAGNRLYVNKGLGMSIVPVRINARPEITYFILGAGKHPV